MSIAAEHVFAGAYPVMTCCSIGGCACVKSGNGHVWVKIAL